jgi:hypothetical protein
VCSDSLFILNLWDSTFLDFILLNALISRSFFHLWYGGGPNFQYEYKLWQNEQFAQWVEVINKNSKSNPLSGANLVPARSSSVLQHPNGHNSRFQNPGHKARQSVFNCIQVLAVSKVLNTAYKGILGPLPSLAQGNLRQRYSGPAHHWCCKACGKTSFHTRECTFTP